MLCHLQHQPALSASHLQCIEDGGQTLIKLDIHNGTDDRYDAAIGDGRLGHAEITLTAFGASGLRVEANYRSS